MFQGVNFQAFALVAEQITGIGLKALSSSQKVFQITGPALSRINSEIVLARTGSVYALFQALTFFGLLSRLFSDIFRVLGPEGPKDSCFTKWRMGSQNNNL